MAERRALHILDPGPLTTVQDLGRPGHAHLGVPRSGCLDQRAMRLANRLVGNDEAAAVLETTAGGVAFWPTVAVAIAVTGARADVRVGGRPAAWGAAVVVPAGAPVVVGPAQHGLRSVVAVAGGIAVAPVLGSRSTDLLSGLGPAALTVGDELPVGVPMGAVVDVDVSRASAASAPYSLELVAGPRADWIDAADVAGLRGRSWTVSATSNRIGLRLEGEPLRWARQAELPSEPLVLGAVQVPPSGQPVVLLNDHATTGGYPVLGVVRRRDLPICAQLRPGATVTLRLAAPPA